MILRLVRRLHEDNRGTGLPEFAVILPVMLAMIMGFFELSYRQYAQSVVQGSLQKAARDGSLQANATNANVIDNKVRTLVKQINANLSDSDFTFTRRNFTDLTAAGRLEPSNGPSGRCAPAPPSPALPYTYTDINSSGTWDDGAIAGQGGAQDAVLYTVTVRYENLTPIAPLLAKLTNSASPGSSSNAISATTVLRNQPYANQLVRPIGTTSQTCPQTSTYY